MNLVNVNGAWGKASHPISFNGMQKAESGEFQGSIGKGIRLTLQYEKQS